MMWDSWVVGVTKWFHVHVTSQEDYGVLAFGVSTTLLGLVGAVKWAGPDAAIEIWDRNRPRHAKVVGCAGKSGHPRGTVFALKTKNDEEEGNGMSLMGGVDDLHIKNCSTCGKTLKLELKSFTCSGLCDREQPS
ncbi:hypothetical protein Pelo_6136 [Pelomyxa schiedti]|nr:hypothetical protein Pelo_6136 [Pelomyxa schiedti]